MRLHNILRIADLYVGQLKEQTVDFIRSQDPTYTDDTVKEHIYGVRAIAEGIFQGTIPNPGAKIVADLEEIVKAMDRKDCSYLRIVYS